MAQENYAVTRTARLNAPPASIYAVIADYRRGHPQIVPKQFSNLTVEQGGVGAGTVIRFQSTVLGKTQHFTGAVSEPEPGRVLVERYSEPAGWVTTFTVNPVRADAADVTITTELTGRAGIAGWIERVIAIRIMRSMYLDELTLLEKVAQTWTPQS